MNKEDYFKFAESINMDELFDEIRRLTGLSDLKFTYKISTNRHDMPYISYESQDIVEKVGFLKLMFSSIKIEQFNSEIKYNEDNNEFYYWGTVHFSYTHPSGGSNGCKFLHCWYKNNTWKFEAN